jgi:hypothetical protein
MDQARDVGGMDLSSDLVPNDGREAEPLNGEASRSRVPGILLIAIVALTTWPIPRLTPSISIDGSWAAGLHQAAHNGIAHGTGIDFTYGPFGFLDVPRLFYAETAIAAVLYATAVHVALIAVLFFATRRRSGTFLAGAVCLTVATVALVEPAEVVPLVYFAACVACLRFTPSERNIRMLVYAGTFFGAFQLLVKFNTGFVIVALAGALTLALPRRRAATLSLHVIGSAVGLFALWMVGGQPVGAFGKWLRNSIEISLGYTSGMATERRPWEYAFVAAAVAGIGLLVFLSRSRLDTRGRYALYALVLLLLFAEWKHGFVRHDVHSMGFYFALAVVAIALMWLNSRVIPAIVLATLLMSGSGLATPHEAQTALFRPTRFIRHVSILTDQDRRDVFMAASLARIKRIVPIDRETVSLLAGHTVHVDPHQALLPWVYGWDWRPVPIFQTYSAYTPELDRFNAKMLAGPDAPERILRVGRKAIDDRDRMFESPDYILSLLCHYEELSARTIYEVVARTANRCGAERLLSFTTDARGFVRAPKAAPDEMVIMRIQMKTSLVEAVRSILFKPASPPGIELRDAKGTQRFRLVEATANDSLVLCVPASAGFHRAFVRTACPESIRVTHRENWSVSFSAISIR